jgi:predicted glycosyltransferase
VFDGECRVEVDGQMTIKDHALNAELEQLISDCKVVICRSGYSTMMDLCQWGKRAIMIPTPGQTEQEFLSERMDKKGYVPNISQTTFKLADAAQKLSIYTGLPKMESASVNWERLFKPFAG